MQMRENRTRVAFRRLVPEVFKHAPYLLAPYLPLSQLPMVLAQNQGWQKPRDGDKCIRILG